MKDLKKNIQKNNMKKLVLSTVLGMFCYCTNNAAENNEEEKEEELQQIQNVILDSQIRIYNAKIKICSYGKKIYYAIEEEGKITFLHKVKMGAVDKSYGIHVASLAHLPKEVIDRADEILNFYETKNKKESKLKQMELPLEFVQEQDERDVVIEKLKKVNPLEITPIDALNILYDIKQSIDK